MATASPNPTVPTRQKGAGLSVFLAFLLVMVFVIPAVGFESSHERLYRDVAFSLMLMGIIAMAWRKTAAFFFGFSVALATLLARWAVWLLPPRALGFWPEALTLASLLLVLYVLLAHVFAPGRVTRFRILGAVAVYLVLGIIFGNIYALATFFDPEAFRGAGAPLSTIGNWSYFSLMTLTTVGYGDIVPVHPVARLLAIGEALTGQLYLAVLLAHLVSMHVRPTEGESRWY